MEILTGQETAGGRGMGGHDREECQNAQERQELPAQSQTQPVWGGETENGGERLAPLTQGHVKKDPPFSTHPSIHPSIYPSKCPHILLPPLNILGKKNISEIFRGGIKEGNKKGKEGTQGEIEAKDEEMVEDGGSVSGRKRS